MRYLTPYPLHVRVDAGMRAPSPPRPAGLARMLRNGATGRQGARIWHGTAPGRANVTAQPTGRGASVITLHLEGLGCSARLAPRHELANPRPEPTARAPCPERSQHDTARLSPRCL